MKVVAILLLTLGLALAVDVPVSVGGVVGETVPGANVTQCIYRPKDKVISCRGFTGEVECPAVCESHGEERVYKIFGLGYVPELVDAKPELVRYWLYPRSLDNVTYFNRTVITEGGVRDLFLYYGEKFVELGLRVTDLKCYERIVRLIRVSSVEHIVNLESELEVKPTVPLVGEVLVLDKEVSKRWLWGYGWGLGYGGWGYGGLGYGYPFGLYGR